MLDSNTWRKLKRGPQIITLKDASLISGLTGLQSGDRVVDAGAGSGYLAIYLGSIAAPDGNVVTYENRAEFADLAKKNITRAGLEKVVELKEKDAFSGFDEKDVDLVTLDMAESEKVLIHAKDSVKMGGWIVGYIPNVEQANRFVMEAEKLKLRVERVTDAFLRDWKIRSYGSRPENTGLIFTAFLVFLRKVSEAEFDSSREENTKANRREKRIKNKLG
ncbi:MAG TPA: methyltransferase domain-containing protein [Candidatus Norongarragalinales archaeon]|nr:methyltransferase domain-containing protein [Candidatus Norongarragalinales archaeon]